MDKLNGRSVASAVQVSLGPIARHHKMSVAVDINGADQRFSVARQLRLGSRYLDTVAGFA